jgi:uncharacterized protein (DUF2235 family)
MPDAPMVVASISKKRLAVFLDGTWNAVNDNTNVWRLKSLCSANSRDGAAQLVYYDIGVNGFAGGVFGKGLDTNVTEAYQWLIEHFDPGDEIFIFGFSRGAYTARSLSGLIAKHGLLKPGAPISVKQLYERYHRSSDRTLWTLLDEQRKGNLTDASLEEKWLMKYSQAIPIKMVGVWDTVGALGIPFFSIEGISRSTFGFLHTGLRLSIENGFHALAIDEHRRDFAPTLWTVRHPKEPKAVIAEPRGITSVEQRWFVGAHANVGGGYDSDLLAQIPLRWMMKKASGFGLTYRYDVAIEGDVHEAAVTDSYKEFVAGAYHFASPSYDRPIGAPPEEREDGTHFTINETLDRSVFDRWRNVSDYRPANLMDWAKQHGVDIAKLQTSVRADDPQTEAPD